MKFRSKLTLFLLLLVLVISGFYYFTFDYNAKSFFLSKSKEDLLGQARLARLLIMNTDPSKISSHQLAVKIGGEINARITIVDHNGSVIGDSVLKESELSQLDNHLHRPEIQAALHNGAGSSVRYSDTVKTSMLYIALPYDAGTHVGFVRLARPLRFLTDDEAKLYKMVGGALLLTMLMALGLSFIISKILSRPLIEMTLVATQISNQEEYQHIKITSQDEIGTLARVLNNMGDRINAQMHELVSEKNRLDAILRGMGEGVLVVLADGTIVLVNPPFRDYFSFNGDEEGKNIFEISDNPELLSTFNEINESGKELVREIQIQKAETTLLTHWVPMKVDSSGEGIVVVFHDITERKRYEDALGKSEQRFRSVVECSLTGMHFITLEPDGRLVLTDANPAADRIVGISHWPLLSRSVEIAFPWLKGDPILDIYRKVASGELGPQSFEYELRFDNKARYYDVRVFLTGYMTISVEFADITERKRLQDELRELSERDFLTEIYNRRKLYELLLVESKKAERHARPLSLILFDIDHFKNINDTYGHDIGDMVLKSIASIVSDGLRSTDIFARYGGEEFVIVCPETTMDGASALAEKIRITIEQYNFTTVGRVTISSGVSSFKNGDTNNTFIKHSDTALYVAKETGRNRVVRAT